MDPLLISALGVGLFMAFQKIMERGVIDPALEKGLEPLRQWLTRGYEKKKDEDRLRLAVEGAIQDASASLGPAEWNQNHFETALATIKANPKLAAQVAAAAVAMTTEVAERVPMGLLDDLNLPREKRGTFVRFLFCLRKQLASLEDFHAGIDYANQLDRHGLLDDLLGAIRRQMGIYEAILADRRLTTDDEKALRGYLDYIREQSRFMPLPMTRQNIPGARTDADLDEVFVPLTVRDPREQENVRRKGGSGCDVNVLPATFGEVFNRYPCFLLKGPPGCGKTTLLHRAALAFAAGTAQANLDWEGPALLPIFLRLRNFGAFLEQNRARFVGPAPGALTAFMENHFREEYRLQLSPGFFDRRLEEGQCLLLLDGLDEVTTDRPEVAQYVGAFIQEFRKCCNRFVLASRPKGYETVEFFLRHVDPAVVEVNPLDADGIRRLVKNLLITLEYDSAERARDVVKLSQAILSSPKLKEIAGTPLFCTALVLVYKYHGATLPQRRVDVYHEIVDLLLGFWKAQDWNLTDAHKLATEDGTGAAIPEVSAAVALKKRRLAHMALWMQQEGVSDVPAQRARETLKKYLEQRESKPSDIAQQWAERFLSNAHERSGLLVEAEAEKYAFTHQGFREYLAATGLKNKREKEFISLVRAHVTDDWWEQVILLAGAHPELSDDLRSYLVSVLLKGATNPALSPDDRHTHLLMVGQCAADMAGLLPGPQRQQVEKALYAAMVQKDLKSEKRLQAGEVLDAIGWMPADLDDFILIQDSGGFWISKYPVTNLQYLRFLSSLDYADPELWKKGICGFDVTGQPLGQIVGEQAWQWFTQNGGQEIRPRFWDDAYFGASRRLFPVVGVTWYEAAAYCAWLGRHWRELKLSLPGDLSFRLPMEAEWVAAACGKAAGPYPWQQPSAVTRETISMYANTYESDLHLTTPVCMYPDGLSLAGLMDMSGNVWEWQATQQNEDQGEFALRGGAWSNGWDAARVEMCIHDIPADCGNSTGFRVVGATLALVNP